MWQQQQNRIFFPHIQLLMLRSPFWNAAFFMYPVRCEIPTFQRGPNASKLGPESVKVSQSRKNCLCADFRIWHQEHADVEIGVKLTCGSSNKIGSFFHTFSQLLMLRSPFWNAAFFLYPVRCEILTFQRGPNASKLGPESVDGE